MEGYKVCNTELPTRPPEVGAGQDRMGGWWQGWLISAIVTHIGSWILEMLGQQDAGLMHRDGKEASERKGEPGIPGGSLFCFPLFLRHGFTTIALAVLKLRVLPASACPVLGSKGMPTMPGFSMSAGRRIQRQILRLLLPILSLQIHFLISVLLLPLQSIGDDCKTCDKLFSLSRSHRSSGGIFSVP